MPKQHNQASNGQASPTTVSRRVAIMTTAAIPLAVKLPIGSAVAEDALAGLIKAAAEKNAAFMRGDMQRWSSLTRIARRATASIPAPSDWQSSRSTSRTDKPSWTSRKPTPAKDWSCSS